MRKSNKYKADISQLQRAHRCYIETRSLHEYINKRFGFIIRLIYELR